MNQKLAVLLGAAFLGVCAPLAHAALEITFQIDGGVVHTCGPVPTLGGVTAAAISDVAAISPPRSWPNDRKQRFKSLPYDLQVYVAAHEAQREKALRRAQNEAASTRQKMEACHKPQTQETQTETTEGIEAHAIDAPTT